ncbi:hypothetical protein E2C01_081424 [Portunus trituberculatus]|uniref:Uncharacterized protein n=1 Tax=Portunus trituberculatus TaxID=210409 RepID=A0A5B7IPR4_PORTR|nr:hypothetical protein [Portunus trituberculatus]
MTRDGQRLILDYLTMNLQPPLSRCPRKGRNPPSPPTAWNAAAFTVTSCLTSFRNLMASTFDLLALTISPPHHRVLCHLKYENLLPLSSRLAAVTLPGNSTNSAALHCASYPPIAPLGSPRPATPCLTLPRPPFLRLPPRRRHHMAWCPGCAGPPSHRPPTSPSPRH